MTGTPGTITNGVTQETATLSWAQLQAFGGTLFGTYPITALASDTVSCGGTSTKYTGQAAATLTVQHIDPVVAASGPANVALQAPYAIQFSVAEAGSETPTAWTVNWGDGQTSSYSGDVTSATHVYQTPDTYSVSVGVFDGTNDAFNGGKPCTAAPFNVAVDVVNDSVSAGGPYTIAAGANLTLTATAPSGPGYPPTEYEWDINGDGKFTDAESTSPSVTIT